ncbi:MAG: YXWGXW repeat-containing protein [Rhodobacteraceae bacterium]|nr:YXWGXW repeat-containing protein [Paracoccaceae bacterium]
MYIWITGHWEDDHGRHYFEARWPAPRG